MAHTSDEGRDQKVPRRGPQPLFFLKINSHLEITSRYCICGGHPTVTAISGFDIRKGIGRLSLFSNIVHDQTARP